MKRKIINLLMFFILILPIIAANNQGKGTLNVEIYSTPLGKTKKYMRNQDMILDTGILNSESRITEIPLLNVMVKMRTEATGAGGGDANGIGGEFNGLYKLNKFSGLENYKLKMGTLKNYKGNGSAVLEVYTKNLKITHKKINKENLSMDGYVFVAHTDEATIDNQILELEYTFDLYLNVTGAVDGDIVRQDIITETGGEAVAWIKDIIKEQFLYLAR